MPGITATYAMDMRNVLFDTLGTAFEEGTAETSTSTVYSLRYVHPTEGWYEVYRFTGTGFTYVNGAPTGGTITEFSYFDDEAVASYTVTGLSLSVQTLASYIQNDDAIGLVTLLLAGADTFLGSDMPSEPGDYLFGFGGDDQMFGRAGHDTLNGDDGNDLLRGGTGDDELNGGAGLDTADYADAAAGVRVELLTTGAQNTGGAGVDTLDSIENAVGSGFADQLIGSQAANRLTGGDGNDALIGLGGADILDGGAGNDYIHNNDDFVFPTQSDGVADTLSGGEGNDIIDVGRGDVADGGTGFDRLTVYAVSEATQGLTADFSASPDVQAALSALYGGTFTGFEVFGFSGTNFNDSIIGHNNGDSDPLGSTLEGWGGNDVLDGRGGRDFLFGGDGDDRLDGGTGIDSLNGGQGADWYYVDNAGDTVTEAAGQGSDRVYASATWAASASAEIELITTSNAAGTGALWLTGSDTANQVVGNAGDNRLYGMGGNDQLNGADGADRLYGGLGVDVLSGGLGADILDGEAGADTLAGGLGDDFYYVDDQFDTIVEAAGQGADRIFASVSYVLAAGADVEQMSTTSAAGTAAIDLTGSNLNNLITGNAGANRLFGEGGADNLSGLDGADRLYGGTGVDFLNGGAGDDILDGGTGSDTLVGGLGDDFYYVDDQFDTIVEATGQGNDRIFTSVSYVLAAGADVEQMSTLSAAGTPAINLTGSNLNNTITGNAGANSLFGEGGADALAGLDGNDRLYGGAGVDNLSGGVGNDLLDGGAGNDTMIGGAGDDLYYVDGLGDAVFESAGQGNDRVFATGSFYLGNAEIETLSTTNAAGTTALNLGGSQIANLIYANDGANILDGEGGNDTLIAGGGNDRLAGGMGADALNGGTGNDVYVHGFGEGADTITETSGADSIDIWGLTPSDLVWQVVGNDLYIGIVNAASPGQPASQCADRVRIVGGAVEGSAGYVETVVVGGQTILVSDMLSGGQLAFGQPKDALDGAQVIPLLDDGFVLPGKIDGHPEVLPGLGGEDVHFGPAGRGDGAFLQVLFETMADQAMVMHGPHGPLLLLDDAAPAHKPVDGFWGG